MIDPGIFPLGAGVGIGSLVGLGRRAGVEWAGVGGVPLAAQRAEIGGEAPPFVGGMTEIVTHSAPPCRRAAAVPSCAARAAMAAAVARAAGERGVSIAGAGAGVGRVRPERTPSATRALVCLQLNLLFR